MKPELRQALQSAEDAIAFFARAAVLRHCAGVAMQAGASSEAMRLEGLAREAEQIVGTVIARAWQPLVAPKKKPAKKKPLQVFPLLGS